MTRVYIGRLPARCTERDVEKFFKGYGRLRDIVLKSGYGFVEFDDERDADDAVYDLHGRELRGERIVVEHARLPPRGRAGSRRRESRYGPPTRTEYRVIVENLSSRVSWQDLKDLMRKAGEVTYADAHKQVRNEGIVEFATYSDMKAAIDKYDGYNLYDRRLKVYADKPRHRSRSDSRRSRSRRRSSRSRDSRRSRSRSDSRRRSSSRRSRSGRDRSRRSDVSRRSDRSRSAHSRKSRSHSGSRSHSRSERSPSRHNDRRSESRRSRSVSKNGDASPPEKRARYSGSQDRSRSASRERSRSASRNGSRSGSERRSRSRSPMDRSRSHSKSRSMSRSVSRSHSASGAGDSHQEPANQHSEETNGAADS